VAFVAVQTVFEGFSVNTKDAAKKSADDFGLKIPVAHDSGRASSGSLLMRRYRAGGTPWVAIIDPSGVVVANDFFISAARSVAIIDKLLAAR